jgi:pyruvate/2-oxoglutarate dehydrogenase complex dihydrolipoamide acyltransferase (E2) component
MLFLLGLPLLGLPLLGLPLLGLPASAQQVVPPVGELFASGSSNNSSVQLAGSGMSVYSGSELAAGIAPATLRLARGGQVRICSRSSLNVTSSNQGLMLATGSGAIEIDYQVSKQTADVVITPDFNLALVGPGTFHFALGITKKGDTCMKPLPGNKSEVAFSELLGTGTYKSQPNQTVMFRGGKLDAPEPYTSDCGCPPESPVMKAEATPSPTPVPPKSDNANSADRVAVASNEPASNMPPDKPGQVHVQVDAPFVFSARPPATGRPYSVAKVPLSTLPNTYFVQEKVDPVVLEEKKPDVSLKADAQAAPTPPQDQPKPEKKSFAGRVKGFFGSLFHR